MRHASLIGIVALAAGTAAADETYSTFGADWGYSNPWTIIGQTMSVPEGCTVLESLEFLGEVAHHSIVYTITVYAWDEEDQHVVGEPLFGEFASMDVGDDPLRHFDVGVLLPPGERIAMVLTFEPDLGAGHGVGVTADVFDGGSAIATSGFVDHTWILGESDVNDLVFKAEWSLCAADVHQDGLLNIFDFLAFQGLYNTGDAKADFNGDGVTNILDFVAFQSAFLEGC